MFESLTKAVSKAMPYIYLPALCINSVFQLTIPARGSLTMSIFGEGRNTTVNGETFNAATNLNAIYQTTRPSGKLMIIDESFHSFEADAQRKGMDRLMEAVSPNAFYDSDNRDDPPKCHPNTRIAVINLIIDWANGMIDTFMLWLYGPAGAGKTAIARRIAEIFAEHGFLLASFLFFRSDPKQIGRAHV